MKLQISPIFDADNGALMRYDLNVCCYEDNKGRSLWRFVDSFAPDNLIKTMENKARAHLLKAETLKAVHEFKKAIVKMEAERKA